VKRLNDWFKRLTTAGKVFAITAISFLTLGMIGIASQPSSAPASSKSPTTTNAPSKPSVKSDTTEVKNVATTEVVAFTSSTIEDASLAQGLTQVRAAGVNGTRTITTEVTSVNGIETSRKEVSNSITTPPINELIAKGAKAPQPSCPNGTYVNSQGNTVCSPYQSNAAPAGATAQCRDGSYSFSQSRSGTCSHHGGVASWL